MVDFENMPLNLVVVSPSCHNPQSADFRPHRPHPSALKGFVYHKHGLFASFLLCIMAFADGLVNPMFGFMYDLVNSGPNDGDFVPDEAGGMGDDTYPGNKDDTDDDDDNDITPNSHQVIDLELDHSAPHRSLPAKPINVAEICRQMKLHKNLSPKSEAELDVFAIRSSFIFCSSHSSR
jgi:hypothetical protein